LLTEKKKKLVVVARNLGVKKIPVGARVKPPPEEQRNAVI